MRCGDAKMALQTTTGPAEPIKARFGRAMRVSLQSLERARAAWRPSVLVTILLVAEAMGCGRVDLSPSHPDGGTAREAGVASLQAIFNAYCAAARICCAGYTYTDLADCERRAPTLAFRTPLVEKGQASINSAAIPDCEAAYKQAGTTCDLGQVGDACRALFVGLQGEGQPCGTVYACASADVQPTICLTLWSATSGTCRKLEHGKTGDHCDGTCAIGEDCLYNAVGDDNVTWCFEADGLYCSPVTKPQPTCAPLVAVGGDCADEPWSCGAHGYCDSSSLCRRAASLGQQCDSTTEPCDLELSCGPGGTCVVAPQPFADYLSCRAVPRWL